MLEIECSISFSDNETTFEFIIPDENGIIVRIPKVLNPEQCSEVVRIFLKERFGAAAPSAVIVAQ